MKRKNFFISFCLGLILILPAFVYPEKFSTSKKVIAETEEVLNDLELKESTFVKSFSGILFECSIVGGQLEVDISSVNKVEGHTHENLLLTLIPNVPKTARETDLANWMLIKNCTWTHVVLGKKEDTGLIKFNMLDKNGLVRSSEWYDPETGFNVRTAYFDENGLLLSVEYYTHLKFNGPQLELKGPKKVVLLRPKNSDEVLIDAKKKTLEEIEKFCEDIFEKNFQILN